MSKPCDAPHETGLCTVHQTGKDEIHQAQIDALRWLQGKASGQLVKAFIQVHVEMLERVGYAIKDNGVQR